MPSGRTMCARSRETLFSNLVGGQDDFWKTSLRRHMYWERLGFHGQSLAK